MTLTSYPELMKLPDRQKLMQYDALWQAGISDATPIAAKQKKLLDTRWAVYRAGKTKRITLEELDRRLAKVVRSQPVEVLEDVEADLRARRPTTIPGAATAARSSSGNSGIPSHGLRGIRNSFRGATASSAGPSSGKPTSASSSPLSRRSRPSSPSSISVSVPACSAGW